MAVSQAFNVVTDEAQAWLGGLVFAIAFDRDGVGQTLSNCDASTLDQSAREGWLWLHFNLADMRTQTFLRRHAVLSPAVRTMLLDDEDRHVALGDGQAVGLILSDFQTEFDGAAAFEPARLRLAFGERLVISVRRHPLMCVEKVRRAVVVSGRRIETPGALIGALGDAFIDAASDHIETFADRFDDLEDAVIAGLSDAGHHNVARMRRTLLRLHREVSPMRSLMRRLGMLAAENPASPAASAIGEASRLVTALDGLDNEVRDLQARARLIREEIEALASAETNRQLFILSVLSAVFLPGTLVTGLFGMNTRDLPFAETAGGFWFALVFVGMATAFVMFIIRWLGGRR